MVNKKKIEQETLATIDAAKAIVENVAVMLSLFDDMPTISLYASGKPIEYLLKILASLGASEDDIKNFLTNFLFYVTPVLEVSVKAILLTNLKKMVSCSVDPRIPYQFRKMHKQLGDTNTSQERGVDIDIESIDFLDKLSVSPLSDSAGWLYFGTDNVDDVYKFARAEDFDAFLWFVIHKGKFPNATTISEMFNPYDTANAPALRYPQDGTLFSVLEYTYNSSNASSILLGNVFSYGDNSHILSMCIDRKYDDADNIVHNTLVPVSDDWNSVNWYSRGALKMLGDTITTYGTTYKKRQKKTANRDYTGEKSICNLQYINQSSSSSPIVGLVNNKLRFTILPKPYVHTPKVDKGEPPWRFKKFLFNDKCEYDRKGRLSFIPGLMDKEGATEDNGTYESFFIDGEEVCRMDYQTGEINHINKNLLVKNLCECYPGLTVYEFNYDFVMSIKLFDPKVLAHALFESVSNINVGFGISISQKRTEAAEAVKEIIREIINTDDSTLNECYYSFDGSKYDAMLRKAEEKRSRNETFGNTTMKSGDFSSVEDILSEYDSNATLHERADVLHRAITQASVSFSENADEKEEIIIRFKFLCDLVEKLTQAIVMSILTPKVLLLLEVNQHLMGGKWEKFTIRDLLLAMRGIIVEIIREVRDMVLKELLKMVMRLLGPLKETILYLIGIEMVDGYMSTLRDLLLNCPTIPIFGISFGNKFEDTHIDNVDYADIDASSALPTETPSTNNC